MNFKVGDIITGTSGTIYGITNDKAIMIVTSLDDDMMNVMVIDRHDYGERDMSAIFNQYNVTNNERYFHKIGNIYEYNDLNPEIFSSYKHVERFEKLFIKKSKYESIAKNKLYNYCDRRGIRFSKRGKYCLVGFLDEYFNLICFKFILNCNIVERFVVQQDMLQKYNTYCDYGFVRYIDEICENTPPLNTKLLYMDNCFK